MLCRLMLTPTPSGTLRSDRPNNVMQTKCILPCDEDVQLETTSIKLRLNTPSYLRMVCVITLVLYVATRFMKPVSQPKWDNIKI